MYCNLEYNILIYLHGPSRRVRLGTAFFPRVVFLAFWISLLYKFGKDFSIYFGFFGIPVIYAFGPKRTFKI